MAHDVFISYSSRDSTTALAVVNALETAGIRCWIAPRDIKAGHVWAQAIVEAIAASRAMVLVFSSHANRSGHVVNELDSAIRKGAIVVPFRIENVMPEGAMEFHLRSRHWLDALTPDLGKHIGDLVGTMKTLLGQPAGDAPAPTEFGMVPPRAPVSKSRPVVQTTASGFHFKVPKPTLGLSKSLKRSALIVAIAVVLFAGSRLLGKSGVTLTAFEFRQKTEGSDFRARLTPTSIRFFEDGNQATPFNSRRYSKTFVVAQARYIYTEVYLQFDPPQRALYVPLNCTIFDAADGVVANFTLANRITPEAKNWYNESGWGAVNPGTWKPGTYRADCRYGDKSVARGSFDLLN